MDCSFCFKTRCRSERTLQSLSHIPSAFSCNNSNLQVTMPPAKKQRVMQRYRDEYHNKWPCITAVPSSPHDANCSTCGFTIKIGNGGKSDIQAHINSAKHQKNASAKQGTQRINMFAALPAVKSNADLAVSRSNL